MDKKKSAHIGFNVLAYGSHSSMEIVQTSAVDDGAFIPASDVQIHSTQNIKNLRDFCDELLKEEAR